MPLTAYLGLRLQLLGRLAHETGWLWLALLALAGWQRATALGSGLALLGWLLVVLGCYGTAAPPCWRYCCNSQALFCGAWRWGWATQPGQLKVQVKRSQ